MVAVIDLLELVFALLALLVFLIYYKRSRLSNAVKLSFLGLVSLSFFSGLSNFLEWSGVTDYFDQIEDHIEILVPALWFFFFFAFLREGVVSDLKESEERYRSLFEDAHDAIVIIYRDMVVDCNEETLRMFGCSSREDVIGKTAHIFSPKIQPGGEDSAERAEELLREALKGGGLCFEWQHMRLDRSLFDVETCLSPIEINRKIYVQAIIRDITERKSSEKQILEYRDHLEELVKERTVEVYDKMKKLEQAMGRIKTLEGLVPTCAKCKKMLSPGEDPKEDKSWIPMEKYISSRTQAEFTHGLCPECLKVLYKRDK